MPDYSLVIDTAFETCQVGLAHGDQLIAHDNTIAGGQHDRVLAGMTKKILDGEKISIKDVRKIIVTTGPGRFTGLRVGIAFVRGLSLVHQTPLVGVLTTDVFAADLKQAYPSEKNRAVIVTVKRGESFIQFLDQNDLAIHVIPDADLLTELTKRQNPFLGGVISPETILLLKNSAIKLAQGMITPRLETILALGFREMPSGVVRPYYAASYAE